MQYCILSYTGSVHFETDGDFVGAITDENLGDYFVSIERVKSQIQ